MIFKSMNNEVSFISFLFLPKKRIRKTLNRNLIIKLIFYESHLLLYKFLLGMVMVIYRKTIQILLLLFSDTQISLSHTSDTLYT